MIQRISLAALRRSFSLLAISTALFACSSGSETETPPSSSAEEMLSSSSTSETLPSSSGEKALSSSSIDEISSSSMESNSLLLNFTSDYTTGLLHWMTFSSESFSSDDILFDQDSKVFANGKDIFVLERKNWGATNILSCMQADKIGDKTLIKQTRLEDISNPYEVAIVENKGYIALYDLDYVQIFNPATCALSGKINLPITEANAASIKASGDTLLVVAQRLENFRATKPGLLIRINASTETVIDTIQLKFYNPQNSALSNGKLYISSPDDWYNLSFVNAGVEVVDLATGTSDVLVTGTALGGGFNHIALDEANQILYVSVYEDFGREPVKPVNVSNKTVGEALPNITDSFGSLFFDNVAKKLFVGDRGFGNEGLKIYDPETKSIITIKSKLPPYSLAVARW
ncbi:MAG: hypothetical protein FWB90_04305 [Fibromonadales bacterium]|nr:hypothetical protein [Fibromonadales bacterium]